ncbi:transcriptional regulator [Paenibacillus woosongensis]|uniref:Transcriptional regulator n=1 Tax=Paenibacillus woosongensis TaxID=307580 RepID=A0AA95I8V9_9BACL|nr:transcriptional regulator [Paenibacillus woosongensis]WHX48677.1 transcriptional regulator [Paenibacillus woosongensis]
MNQENMNLRKLASSSNINAGTLSSILNKHKTLTVDHLDRLTRVMNYPEGYFYEQYIKDHLSQNIPNWRRFKPFLYRCADLDKLDCIKQVISLLMDNLMYSPLLFEVAEDLYQQNKRKAAELLFENVALSEKHQHSERLAFCQYRLFSIRLGSNQEDNYKAAILFEPYVDRLDELDQLDALRDLGNIYRSLNQWDKVDVIASRLSHLAKSLYFTARPVKIQEKSKPSRPLFTYIALANLFHADACDSRRDYKQALQYTSYYADFSWVKEDDDNTRHWITVFMGWAKANTYVIKLMTGDTSILPEYVAYIDKKQDELMTGLYNILEAANLHHFNVDEILKKFESEITSYINQEIPAKLYETQFIENFFSQLLYKFGYYYLSKHDYNTGFGYLLKSLDISSSIYNKKCIIKCMGLFEQYRDMASQETLLTYKTIIKGVYENEEKNSDTSFDS